MQPLIPFYQVPVFHLGPLAIHGFGILVALGFYLGGNLAASRAERVGLARENIDKLVGQLVIGTFVGGHIGYGLMYAREEYFANPWLFLQFWHGLSSFGGFVVCVPLAMWFFYKRKLPVWPYMDSLAIGLSLGWFLGRMGCTVAHDHPGSPSNFFLAKYCRPVEGHTLELPSWAVDSSVPHDLRWGPCLDVGAPVLNIHDKVDPAVFHGVIAAHDVGFYEALWSISLMFVFLLMDKIPRKPGIYVTLMGVAYAPFRFWLDTMRPESTDNRWFVGSVLEMTPGQFWSIIFFVVSLWGLYRRLRSDDALVGPIAKSGAV